MSSLTGQHGLSSLENDFNKESFVTSTRFSDFESGLSMTDFTVRNNILINFDSHNNNNSNSEYINTNTFSLSKMNISSFDQTKPLRGLRGCGQRPTAYQVYQHDREMYEIELEDGSSLLFSPEHKVYGSVVEKELISVSLLIYPMKRDGQSPRK